MRHWLFGGRTDLANLVLLCDTDHGLVHDHELVLSRQGGRLIVLTPDGHHIWGTADAAFRTGLAGVDTRRTTERAGATDPFIGVHPIDDVTGRRPTDTSVMDQDGDDDAPLGRALCRRSSKRRRPGPRRPGERRAAVPAGHHPRSARTAHRRARRLVSLEGATAAGPTREATRLSRVLFPDGEPTLADALQERYDRMDLRFAIGVLMGNRDLTRRLAAETGRP
jgi:hypothetical protein